eukprot:scaffold1501_cov352-Pavlova_lutheri.AAC.37
MESTTHDGSEGGDVGRGGWTLRRAFGTLEDVERTSRPCLMNARPHLGDATLPSTTSSNDNTHPKSHRIPGDEAGLGNLLGKPSSTIHVSLSWWRFYTNTALASRLGQRFLYSSQGLRFS